MVYEFEFKAYDSQTIFLKKKIHQQKQIKKLGIKLQVRNKNKEKNKNKQGIKYLYPKNKISRLPNDVLKYKINRKR